MASIPLPVGQFPSSKDVIARAGDLAAAAQKIYDAWEQDADGMDLELGPGGICQDVASAMAGVLSEMGADALSVPSSVGANHVFVVCNLEDGRFEVDIPFSRYEQGAAYVFKKIPDVKFEADDVIISRLGDPLDPDEFAATYSD